MTSSDSSDLTNSSGLPPLSYYYTYESTHYALWFVGFMAFSYFCYRVERAYSLVFVNRRVF